MISIFRKLLVSSQPYLPVDWKIDVSKISTITVFGSISENTSLLLVYKNTQRANIFSSSLVALE